MLPKVRSKMPAKLSSIQLRQIAPFGLFCLLLRLVFDPTPTPFINALPDLSQPPTQVLVQPSDDLGRENDGFGMSISASSPSSGSPSSSPTVLIGAPFEDLVGAAYVFGQSGSDGMWRQLQRLVVAGDGGSSEAFGSSVAVDGDLIVVGDPDLILDGTLWDPHGAAHIFYRDGGGGRDEDEPWRYIGRVTSPVSEDRRGEFGVSVAVGPAHFAIGEKSAGIDGSYHNVGAVHVYSYSIDPNDGIPSWELLQTIYPPDPYQGPAFGSSVSLAADVLVIGEPDRRTGEGWDIVSNVGRAYVYRRSDGEDPASTLFDMDAVLAPETDDRKQYFGTSVALSDDGSTVVVGAEGDWLMQVRAGGAFAFDLTTGPPVRTPLIPEDGANVTEIARFGRSVMVNSDGSLVAVGAPGMLQGGAAYLFSTDESGDRWEHLGTVTAELEPLNFGHALAFAEDAGTTALALMVTDPGDVPEKVHVYADALQQVSDNSSDALDAASRSENVAASGGLGGDDDSAATAVRPPSLLSLIWSACAAAAIAVVSL